MEIQGLNDLIVWTYDNNQKIITDPDQNGFVYDGDKGKVFDPKTQKQIPGVYKMDLASVYGVTQANITGLAPSVQKVYGSNFVAEVNQGTEQPAIAMAANDIPHLVYDLLTGLKKDKFGGYARKGKSSPKIGGVIAHSYNTHAGVDFYFAFPMGIYVPGELNMQTNNENANVVHDALTLNAQARGVDQLLYEKFYSDEKDFDYANMINYITGQATVDVTADNKQATDVHGTPTALGK